MSHVRRVVPLVLVLATLLPQITLAGAWYRCSYDRVARETCCCPPAAHGENGASPAEQTAVRRASCCDLLTSDPRSLDARVESSSAPRTGAPDLVAVLAPLQPIGTGGPAAAAPAVRATAPPAGPAPLYLRHASLLL